MFKIRITVLAAAALFLFCAVPSALTAGTPAQDDGATATEAERELGEIIADIKIKMQTEPPAEIMKMAEDRLSNFIEKYRGQDEEAQARITLGQVYTAMGREDMAIREYELALKTAGSMGSKEKAMLMYYLASSYVQAEQFDKAEGMYSRILDEISPADGRIEEAVRKEMGMLETKRKLIPGSPAISFPDGTKNLSGEDIAINDFMGKVVLIDFWATWCKPCLNEMPNVKKIYEKYSDDGFEIIGVSLDRARDQLSSYVKRNDIEWPQIYDGPGGRIATSYAVSAIPSTFLLNREGEIVHKNLRGKALEDAVGELFKKD